MNKNILKRCRFWVNQVIAATIIILRLLGILTFSWRQFFILFSITMEIGVLAVLCSVALSEWRCRKRK